MFELCPCPHGTLHLGRMLRGVDSGRLVVLREVSALAPSLLAAVDLGRSLAHPQLLKSLGVVHSATSSYLANEYLPGVTLLELEAAVRRARFPLRPSVAVRVIKDALRAAAATQRLLSDTAGLSYTRCLFADTVWIAEFGDVLLTDVPVAPLLGKIPDADPALRTAKDLLAAAIHLFQLASGETLSPGITKKIAAYVPEVMAETLARALGVGAETPFSSIEEFVAALDALPNELQAEAHEVSEEIQRRVGSSLSQRRNKLGLLELGAATQDADEVTRVFRSLMPERSAPESAPHHSNPDASSVAEAPRLPAAVVGMSWKEEPTRVDRLPAAIAALARAGQRDTRPPIAERGAANAQKVSSAPRRSSNPKFLWLACFGLIATLALVWWAAATGKSRTAPRPRATALGASS